MIETQYHEEEQERVVVVQANQSLSWRGNVIFACSLGGVSALFGMVLAVQGFWLVLPFAGLETLFLLYAFYLVSKRLSRREVITVGTQAIRVEWGRLQAEQSIEMNRYWSRLKFHLPDSPFETGDLSLTCQGRSVPLGRALGREEKKRLHRLLSNVLHQGLS
ncbi:MAG: DUF2244 domain-containing protein [Granulosicoccaceae bacterium]